MKAKCPNCTDNSLCELCNGRGILSAKFSSGKWYARYCKNINCTHRDNGGCIVGGNSPLKELPKEYNHDLRLFHHGLHDCVFCGSETEWLEME